MTHLSEAGNAENNLDVELRINPLENANPWQPLWSGIGFMVGMLLIASTYSASPGQLPLSAPVPKVCMTLLKKTIVLFPLLIMVVIVWVKVTLTYEVDDEGYNNATFLVFAKGGNSSSASSNSTSAGLLVTALLNNSDSSSSVT